ncbi:hypothetical protein BDV28DRAFT_149490 [Aspergillus coremiiformis]|uniref:ubiquitinyl hydrolase 1 n=1 Tax=Aspergillus coremiiformis TaxID=138285 RepID=A0A5N6Z2U9_9EURO|nr:hypothetical protein BDV28DRAFT_149490 [Aspergillus coremiiformis]
MSLVAPGKLSVEAIEYLVNHIFLPPKVPQEEDYKADYEKAMLKVVVAALKVFKSHAATDWHSTTDSVIQMVQDLDSILYADGFVNKDQLHRSLKGLCVKDGTLLLHIREQNCGIMFTKMGDLIQIEAFELLPKNGSVMATKGRLRRSFPGPALSMKMEDFEAPDFQIVVAETLAKMSHQPAPGTKPKVKKAGHFHSEDRDTTHPKIVTELFFNFLRPQCVPVKPRRVWKNTRDEVMWNDSLQPWHRSSLWLLLRVGIQLVFSRHQTQKKKESPPYKVFMVFLLSHILEISQTVHLPCELLHIMQAKIAHRLLKLDSLGPDINLNPVADVVRAASTLLNRRWTQIQKQAEPTHYLSLLEKLNFHDDSFHDLPALNEYIKGIAQRGLLSQGALFEPQENLFRPKDDVLPEASCFSSNEYKIFNLHAFEKWVSSNLDTWITIHEGETSTCGELSNLVRAYHQVAIQAYSESPVAMSIMILTILELWIACDKSATCIDKDIHKYDIGIPLENICQCLLLPCKSQMQRLERVENYIHSRAKASSRAPALTFQSFGHPESFSVLYFRRSPLHQELLSEIEARATKERENKRAELQQKKAKYNELMRLYDEGTCDMREEIIDHFNDIRETSHCPWCERCSYRNEARSIQISAHEWPLPRNFLETQSTVFELKVPPWYGVWRDTALYLLIDVFEMKFSTQTQPSYRYPLSSYSGLAGSFTPFKGAPRLGLLSEDKPHGNTHRKNKLIVNVIELDVCLENALHYKYFDDENGVFTSSLRIPPDHIPKHCIYRLPKRSSSLQSYLCRPAAMPSGASPNSAIASQSDCPDHLSLEEYKALAQLPLGYRLQWENILLHLALPTVDFRKVETTLFVLQVIYQTGPRQNSNALRDSHNIINDTRFAQTILDKIDDVLQSLKENWECVQALYSLICLTTRLLTLSSSVVIQMTCMELLAKMRKVAYAWIGIVKNKVDESTCDRQRQTFMGKSVFLALICVGSFDVDQHHLGSLLGNPEDASTLIQCSIIISEKKSHISESLDPLAPILHMNWKRLLYCAYPILLGQIVDTSSISLDDGIRKSWTAYRPNTKWRKHSEQMDYWLVASTASQNNGSTIPVQYNLLTGELLANGHPLASLPSNYEQHSTYRTLFGRSSIEVMPSAVNGMRFSSKKRYAEHTIHFGIDETGPHDHDLRVRIEKEYHVLELVPPRLLHGKFPSMFVRSFVHWYNLREDRLEFRPVKDPWSSSPNMWCFVRAGRSRKWCLLKEDHSLINIESPTACTISRILAPLEDPDHIHTIFHGSMVDVELPRLQVSFSLKPGDRLVHSRQFRGYCIDTNQSLGTLVGLHNRLILKHQKVEKRLVLLLDGTVSIAKSNDHVAISVSKASNMKLHPYHIDKQLGRLVDNGTLQSKLLLCYFHGLTSFCIPDPLTGKTGTEQALSILKSAAVRSFDPLTAENLALLQNITKLSPGREFYPEHAKEMQKVAWNSELGFLTQHGLYFKEVKSLLHDKCRREFVWGIKYQNLPDWDRVHSDLLIRDLIRSSTFRTSNFGAEEYTHALDAEYLGRDRHQDSQSGQQAFISSDLIYNEHDSIYYSVSSPSILWEFLAQRSSLSEIHGQANGFPMSELGYDAQLLTDSYQSMSKYWINLHTVFSKKLYSSANKYKVMMWLSTLAFADNASMPAIQTLIAFYTVPEMIAIQAPHAPLFHLSDGRTFVQYQVEEGIKRFCRPISETPEAKLQRDFNNRESAKQFRSRQKMALKYHRANAVNELVEQLMGMWPCKRPAMHGYVGSVYQYIDVKKAVNDVTDKFTTWYNNKLLFEYLGEVVNLLGRCGCYSLESSWPSNVEICVDPSPRQAYISIDDIFTSRAPSPVALSSTDLTDLILRGDRSEDSMVRLSMMVEWLDTQALSNYEKDYVGHLRGSLERLGEHFEHTSGCLGDANITSILYQHKDDCKRYHEKLYNMLLRAASPNSITTQRQLCLQIVADANLWPRLSPTLFLEQLRHDRFRSIPDAWKDRIVTYGLALTRSQRATRLVDCLNNTKDLIKELQNPGHRNWSPHEFPDSLLLEIESGILIRDIQEEIARQMRTGEAGRNAVMQLNMGEGKSSVIVPIVSSSLADGTRLVRVIVAKPQAKQTFRMLVSKLGGMLGRPIYHLPFSRALKLNSTQAREIRNMCQECMENGGVFLVQPEQILSLKLMALECLIAGKSDVGKLLLETQAFFDEHARDLVDESDENFSVKFELVYTMGDQKSVQLSPERWILIHQVLDLVRMYTPDVKRKFPLVELGTPLDGNFPRTRVFEVAAQRDLFALIATHICETGVNGFPIARQPEALRKAVYTYITVLDLTSEQIRKVEEGSSGFWGDTTRDVLFLLRGLLAGGILAFVFGVKRWRVNYGLTTTRETPTRLAVPYRAKDNPTARSEFSHPDVVIILTCLSYYYGGISDADLFLSFSHLLNTDQADVEYQLWVKDSHQLPKEFQQLVSINLEDRYLCTEKIFPSFRFAKSVVDYFLEHLVFPKEMKEFPYKLSASGWDIGQVKNHPTTGFSGTNDSRKVLPLSVEQLDLPEQMHTNALVLEYLLQPENHVVPIPPRDEKQQSDAEVLLSLVRTMNPLAQVILDVGAQVLELTNAEVASEWLRLTSNEEIPQAVVFFDDNDDICVMNRKGQVELLQTSPYANQLDVCYVFLDEAHTRGTDLKLPEHYRAAVTLGANLTKDRLVQACMRMRKLGHGQSVIFCIPDEIQHKIRMPASKGNDERIEVSDVLVWAISETWDDIKRSIPLWATQGQRFLYHEQLWEEARTSDGITMSSEQARKFQEDEAQSLEQRYRPHQDEGQLEHVLRVDQSEAALEIVERCQEFDNVLYHSAKMSEEQERELSPEVQREREVQRPSKEQPLEHKIHPDLKRLITTGVLVQMSRAFQPAFQSLAKTSAATFLDVHQFPGQLLVTIDYSNTVKPRDAASFKPDAYQRSVQWILTSRCPHDSTGRTVAHMVILSPYEAQELYGSIRDSRHVTLHLYAPRSNSGLQPLDRLDLYNISGNVQDDLCIPRSLIIQLNLFAGQLYLSSYEEYVEVCDFLGVAWEPKGEDSIVAADGFILHDRRIDESSTSSFRHSPIKFLKVFMSQIRRNDEGIDKTHMGKIFNGIILRRSDFEVKNAGQY